MSDSGDSDLDQFVWIHERTKRLLSDAEEFVLVENEGAEQQPQAELTRYDGQVGSATPDYTTPNTSRLPSPVRQFPLSGNQAGVISGSRQKRPCPCPPPNTPILQPSSPVITPAGNNTHTSQDEPAAASKIQSSQDGSTAENQGRTLDNEETFVRDREEQQCRLNEFERTYAAAYAISHKEPDRNISDHQILYRYSKLLNDMHWLNKYEAVATNRMLASYNVYKSTGDSKAFLAVIRCYDHIRNEVARQKNPVLNGECDREFWAKLLQSVGKMGDKANLQRASAAGIPNSLDSAASPTNRNRKLGNSLEAEGNRPPAGWERKKDSSGKSYYEYTGPTAFYAGDDKELV